jgi:hypothetical protein
MDMGANVGQYRDFLPLYIGYEGWIASYGRVQDANEKPLQRSLGDGRWRVFQMALGSTPAQPRSMHLSQAH